MLQPWPTLVTWMALWAIVVCDDVTTNTTDASTTNYTAPAQVSEFPDPVSKTLKILQENLENNTIDDFKKTSFDAPAANLVGAPLRRAALPHTPRPAHDGITKSGSTAARAGGVRSFVEKYKSIMNAFLSNQSEHVRAAGDPTPGHSLPRTRRRPAVEGLQGGGAVFRSGATAVRDNKDKTRGGGAGALPPWIVVHAGKASLHVSKAPVHAGKAPVRASRAKLPGGQARGRAAAAAQALLGPRQDDPARAPSAGQLDMAPARGGAVHTLRNKNRLCYRHVLVPEGPKYDSKGRLYLAEHSATRDYQRTKPPRLLLPRCCNCCQKSVLGCE